MSAPRVPPLTSAQAADYLGLTERHVRRLTAEHRIPFVRIGRFIRFLPTDLDAWLEANRVTPRGGSLAAVRPVARDRRASG